MYDKKFSKHETHINEREGTFSFLGLRWRRGDKFNHRWWLALRMVNKEAARLYYNTTRDL